MTDEHIPERLGRALRQAHSLQPVAVGESRYETVADTARGTLRCFGGDGPPLLIIYSLVNRPYILDLSAERSVIRRLISCGLRIYLLEWSAPATMGRFASLDDYLAGDIRQTVRVVSEREGDRPHLLGVCQGGVFALCEAALRPQSIRSLTTLVTPVDFHTPTDQLYRLCRHMDLELIVRATGNVPAVGLNALFSSLKPFQLYGQRYLMLADLADDYAALRDFLRMERWMYDSPDQAAAAFLQFARDFYQRNGLIAGEIEVAGEPVRLEAISVPVFNAYATQDHLVPAAAASALGERLTVEDYHECAVQTGHLGMFISGRAHREVYPALAEWLRRH